jgi:predicted outer membrane repeat protein
MHLIGYLMIVMLMMIMLAPMATASDHLSLLAAAIATNANATSNNTRTVSTDIASTIASWTSLSSSITAAAGKVATLTLSTTFDMTGFSSAIDMETAKTAITIVGNAAVFDAGGEGFFFNVGDAVALVMSNVTLQNGNSVQAYGGGAILVYGTITLSDCTFNKNTAAGGGAITVYGTITLSDCTFNKNTAYNGGYGGAIQVTTGGTITLSDCTFNGNTAGNIGGAIYLQYPRGTITLSDCTFNGNTAGYAGGALYFYSGSNGLLKNCSLLGTVSPKNNDIARRDTTANVTFACADGEVGTPVQMSGIEITKLPALTCTAQTYACHNGGKANWYCVPDTTSAATLAQCHEVCAP